MRTIASRFPCVQRRRRRDDLARWATDLLKHPERYGADERTRVIVADLLIKVVIR